jgi:hypothetical protein
MIGIRRVFVFVRRGVWGWTTQQQVADPRHVQFPCFNKVQEPLDRGAWGGSQQRAAAYLFGQTLAARSIPFIYK